MNIFRDIITYVKLTYIQSKCKGFDAHENFDKRSRKFALTPYFSVKIAAHRSVESDQKKLRKSGVKNRGKSRYSPCAGNISQCRETQPLFCPISEGNKERIWIRFLSKILISRKIKLS